MNNSPYFWLDQLIEREPDVQTLLSAYRAMQHASAPSCSVIIAESGVGKTRLAREMYLRLTREDDKIGYWPQKFGGDLMTMDVVPDFTNHTTGDIAQMPPFLWWSIRFNKSNIRNKTSSSGTSVTDSIGQLLPHLAVISQSAVLSESKMGAVDFTLDTLIEFAPDFFFPGAGFAKTCLLKAYESWKQRKELTKLKGLKESLDSGAQTVFLEPITKISETLSKFIRKGPEDAAYIVPVILFLDDLQFASDIEITQICHILERAIRESWPLQVTVTTWPADWDAATALPNSPLSRFQQVIEKFQAGSFKLSEIRLNKVQDSSSLISTAMPGLKQRQRDEIQKKFSGDIYTLSMCIRNLRNRPSNFVNKDTNRELNSTGLKQALIYPPDRENAIQERFNELSKYYQHIVSICALMGHRSLLNLSHDIAQELQISVQDKVSSEASNAPVGSADSESNWLLREVSTGIVEFVDEISRSVASAQIVNIEDDVKGFVAAALITMQRWIDEGTAELLTALENRYFIAGARSVLTLIADQNHEIENFSIDRFSNCIQIIDEIENGFVVDKSSLPAPVEVNILLSETQALASLSFTWRARWLQRASITSSWLYMGGRPLAIMLRHEGFKLLHELADRIQKGEEDLQLVEAIGRAAKTSVGLTWELCNSEILSERPELSWDADDEFIAWDEKNQATFKEMEAESFENIAKAIATLGEEKTETATTAKVVLWYTMNRMPEYVSKSIYDLYRPRADAFCSLKFSGKNGNRLLEILCEANVLLYIFYGNSSTPIVQETKKESVTHLVRELFHIQAQAAGVYQLFVMTLVLDIEDLTGISSVERNFERAFSCHLELINRGMDELAAESDSIIRKSIRWAIGIHSHQLRNAFKRNLHVVTSLSNGWQKSAEILARIKGVSQRASERLLVNILTCIFYEMAMGIVRTNSTLDLDRFIQEAEIAANGAFRDVSICARIAWSDTFKAEADQILEPNKRAYFNEASYRALSGVPLRLFRILGRNDVQDKALESLKNSLLLCGRQEQLFEITGGIAIERLQSGFYSDLEDWRDTTLYALSKLSTGAMEWRKSDEVSGERLIEITHQTFQSIFSYSETWKGQFNEIKELILLRINMIKGGK